MSSEITLCDSNIDGKFGSKLCKYAKQEEYQKCR